MEILVQIHNSIISSILYFASQYFAQLKFLIWLLIKYYGCYMCSHIHYFTSGSFQTTIPADYPNHIPQTKGRYQEKDFSTIAACGTIVTYKIKIIQLTKYINLHLIIMCVITFEVCIYVLGLQMLDLFVYSLGYTSI